MRLEGLPRKTAEEAQAGFDRAVKILDELSANRYKRLVAIEREIAWLKEEKQSLLEEIEDGDDV